MYFFLHVPFLRVLYCIELENEPFTSVLIYYMRSRILILPFDLDLL